MRKRIVASMAAALMVLLVPALVFASSGYSISGEVQYSGIHTGPIIVVAILEGEENPAQVLDLAGPGPFTLGPLGPGVYQVCAQMDLDNSGGPPGPDEPSSPCALVTITYSSVINVVLVMQDPQAEFVPEPGTMLLLGSGLAGLAGYASLRWRNRK